MRSRASVKPSDYPPLPFHTIRFITFLSSLVVAIILAIFIYHLHADGYKLPFAFLVLLVSSLTSLLTIPLTSLCNCTCSLSTKLSLLLNTTQLLLWLLSLALLAYSMTGTILTQCTAEYWATATGISVCRSYKALFAFTVLGAVSYIAAIWLDVVVRRRQTRLGAYGPMGSSAAVGEDPWDVKLVERRDSVGEGHGHGQGYGHGFYDGASSHGSSGEAGWRPSRGRVAQGYQHPAEQTGYDPAAYR